MSEYRNFNNYELNETTEQPIEAPVYDGSGNHTASVPEQTRPPFDGYGLASVILAPMGCFYGIPAIVGLILGIIGLRKKSRSTLSTIGVVLCSLAIAYLIYCVIFIIRNPEQYQEMLEYWLSSAGAASGTSGRIF